MRPEEYRAISNKFKEIAGVKKVYNKMLNEFICVIVPSMLDENTKYVSKEAHDLFSNYVLLYVKEDKLTLKRANAIIGCYQDQFDEV